MELAGMRGKMEAKGAEEHIPESWEPFPTLEGRAHLLSRPSPGCCCHVAPYLCLPLRFDLRERRQERDRFINVGGGWGGNGGGHLRDRWLWLHPRYVYHLLRLAAKLGN